MKRHILRDITSILYKRNEKKYVYFSLSDYLRERIKLYDDKDTVLMEWITLDNTEQELIRIVRNIYDVISQIGGM